MWRISNIKGKSEKGKTIEEIIAIVEERSDGGHQQDTSSGDGYKMSNPEQNLKLEPAGLTDKA